MASAQTLPCELATKPDFGIGAAMVASPTTWMPGTWVASPGAGLIGHRPVGLVTPARSAIRPACCGGMTLATLATCLPKSVVSVLVSGSTELTLPPADKDTHSRWSG